MGNIELIGLENLSQDQQRKLVINLADRIDRGSLKDILIKLQIDNRTKIHIDIKRGWGWNWSDEETRQYENKRSSAARDILCQTSITNFCQHFELSSILNELADIINYSGKLHLVLGEEIKEEHNEPDETDDII